MASENDILVRTKQCKPIYNGDLAHIVSGDVETPYTWATKAKEHADEAERQAGLAEGSATAAEGSATAAAGSASTASERASFADSRATVADQRATVSDQRATFAEQKASAAASSAGDAASSASLAKAWATKETHPVEGSLYSSKEYAERAGASAESAAGSASSAAGSASLASAKASAAAGSALLSSNRAADAAGSAGMAGGYAATAADRATEAGQARDKAKQWATSLTEVSDGLYGARKYAQDAAGSGSGAEAAAEAAEQARDKARQWALSTEEVEPGKYGAAKYAHDAGVSADEAAASGAKAEQWAVSETVVAEGKYGAFKYAGDAAASATDAGDSATAASASSTEAGGRAADALDTYGKVADTYDKVVETYEWAAKASADAQGHAEDALLAKGAAEAAQDVAEGAKEVCEGYAEQAGLAATNAAGSAAQAAASAMSMLSGNNTYLGNNTFEGNNVHTGAEIFNGAVELNGDIGLTSGTGGSIAVVSYLQGMLSAHVIPPPRRGATGMYPFDFSSAYISAVNVSVNKTAAQGGSSLCKKYDEMDRFAPCTIHTWMLTYNDGIVQQAGARASAYGSTELRTAPGHPWIWTAYTSYGWNVTKSAFYVVGKGAEGNSLAFAAHAIVDKPGAYVVDWACILDGYSIPENIVVSCIDGGDNSSELWTVFFTENYCSNYMEFTSTLEGDPLGNGITSMAEYVTPHVLAALGTQTTATTVNSSAAVWRCLWVSKPANYPHVVGDLMQAQWRASTYYKVNSQAGDLTRQVQKVYLASNATDVDPSTLDYVDISTERRVVVQAPMSGTEYVFKVSHTVNSFNDRWQSVCAVSPDTWLDTPQTYASGVWSAWVRRFGSTPGTYYIKVGVPVNNTGAARSADIFVGTVGVRVPVIHIEQAATE